MQDIRTALRALARRPGFTLIAHRHARARHWRERCDLQRRRRRPAAAAAVRAEPIAWSCRGSSAPRCSERPGFDRLPSSPGDVTDFISRNTTFEQLAWMRADRVEPDGRRRPGAARRGAGQPQLPQTLGVQPVHGRDFADATARRPRRPDWLRPVAAALRRRTTSLGRAISLNGEPATIVGVLPAVVPLSRRRGAADGLRLRAAAGGLDSRRPDAGAASSSAAARALRSSGGCAHGITAAAAEADLDAIAADIAPRVPRLERRLDRRVVPLREQLVGDVRTAAHRAARGGRLRPAHRLRQRREPAARARRYAAARDRGSLRARRRTLADPPAAADREPRAVAGGRAFSGWPSAGGACRRCCACCPPACRRWPTRPSTGAWSRSRRSSRSSPASFSASAPALHASRVRAQRGLREGARGAVGSRRAHRTRNVLVVVEVALAGDASGLRVAPDTDIRPAAEREHRLPGRRRPDDGGGAAAADIPGRAAGGVFSSGWSRGSSVVPGVDSVAATSSIPLAGTENLRQVTIECSCRGQSRGRKSSRTIRMVTDGYFQAMGIPHVAGEPLPRVPRPEQSAGAAHQLDDGRHRVSWRERRRAANQARGLRSECVRGTPSSASSATRGTRRSTVSLRPQVYVPTAPIRRRRCLSS